VTDAAQHHPEIRRARRAIQAAEATRHRVEATLDEIRLRRERDASRPAERAGQLGEDREVGVEPNSLDAPDAKR
jgi:hypothetical protein